jgi:hypothetical protein
MSRSFPSRRRSACPWYTGGGKMNDKNLEQLINIKFCLKVGKSASETFALLTVAYDEYAIPKPSYITIFSDRRNSFEELEILVFNIIE